MINKLAIQYDFDLLILIYIEYMLIFLKEKISFSTNVVNYIGKLLLKVKIKTDFIQLHIRLFFNNKNIILTFYL